MPVRERGRLAFTQVNRRGRPGYDPGLQRHHLLPRQLLGHGAFDRLLDQLPGERALFEDFRSNGLLLPCNENAALRMGLPLHRGPHRRYSGLVIERAGQIEADWARQFPSDPLAANAQAQMRLALLRRALRRFLLDPRRGVPLNRRDPAHAQPDFGDLDALADAMWATTAG